MTPDAVGRARRRAAKSALDRHVTLALETCRDGEEAWVLWANGGAYLASTLAEELALDDTCAATRFRRLGKVLRGAAASPQTAAMAMLRDAAVYVSAA
jgi:hypothetical protein